MQLKSGVQVHPSQADAGDWSMVAAPTLETSIRRFFDLCLKEVRHTPREQNSSEAATTCLTSGLSLIVSDSHGYRFHAENGCGE